MRNIKLILAFDGTNYAGWQRQTNRDTIQGEVEKKIALMTGENVILNGAGRTDAGVHALAMVANFHIEATIPVDGFLRGLNSLLPEDIRILKVEEAPDVFHARRSSKGKCYIYNICVGPVQLPTRRLYSLHVTQPLNIEAVRSCLEALQGEHDFSSFEATGSRDLDVVCGRGAVREIFSASVDIVAGEPDGMRFVIAGDGFLRHMVRNIVGTLIEVGRGKINVVDFNRIMAAKDRSQAGPTAPAHGLFLKEVFYPN